MRSIRRELLVWLLLGIALAVAAAAVGTYWRARDEANALFDYQLKEMAGSLTDAPFAAVPAGAGTMGTGSDAMVVQIWDRNGVQLFLSQPRRVLPQNAQLGFTTLSTDSGPWRVFSALAAEQVVQIAAKLLEGEQRILITRINVEHALHVLEIIEATRASQATGKRIPLQSTFKWPMEGGFTYNDKG